MRPLLFQYRTRGAPAEKVSPLAKLAIVLAVSVVSAVKDGVTVQAYLLFFVLIMLVTCCWIRPRELGTLAWIVIGLNLSLFVLQALVVSGGSPLVGAGPLVVSQHGLAVAGSVAIRHIVLFLVAMGFVESTSARDLGAALHHQGKLPFWFVLMLFMTLRYLTKFERSVNDVREAMLARGLVKRRARWLSPKQAMFFYRLVLFRGFLEGRTLALSLDARGFRMLPYRTYLYVPRFSYVDAAIVLAALIGTLVSIAYRTI